MTLNSFVFFDADSTSTESNVMDVIDRAEDMTLQISGSGSINLQIKGKSDVKDGGWDNISAVSLGSFSAVQSITAAGIYSVPVRGLTKLKIVNSGDTGIKVYGRVNA